MVPSFLLAYCCKWFVLQGTPSYSKIILTPFDCIFTPSPDALFIRNTSKLDNIARCRMTIIRRLSRLRGYYSDN